MENNYQDRIYLKNAEIQIEKDPNRKSQLQRDLEILNLRKQIEDLKIRIQSKLRNK